MIPPGQPSEGAGGRESWYRDLLDSLPTAVYTTDAEGCVTYFNRAAAELAGHVPRIGQDKWCVSWKLEYPNGLPMPHDECPMAIALRENREVRGVEGVAVRPDGTRVPFLPYPTPLRDADGTLVGAVNMLVDISQLKKAEERQKALIDELNHRVKNTLATVQSLASQARRSSDFSSEAGRAFQGRLLALSRTHDHLTRMQWETADFHSILADILAPHDESSSRVTLRGDAVQLSPRLALALSMVLHELVTNAVKYGALSSAEGRLDILWLVASSDEDRRLRINWRESNGPEVTPPGKRGFGSRLVERAVAQEMNGRAEIIYDRSGVRCTIDVPLPRNGM